MINALTTESLAARVDGMWVVEASSGIAISDFRRLAPLTWICCSAGASLRAGADAGEASSRVRLSLGSALPRLHAASKAAAHSRTDVLRMSSSAWAAGRHGSHTHGTPPAGGLAHA